MSVDLRARIVVPEGASREEWLFERGEGVTASRVGEIASGGIRTWRRILEEQMNGSKFRGTAATRAGSSREAALLDEAADHLATLVPNAALWAHAEHDLHRATPDGIGRTEDGRLVAVEVKSHEFGWESDTIPKEHMLQMQWQMHVLGADEALYGFEVRDEDDMPPMGGATWIVVPRDDETIGWLAYRADQYLAWRAAGCPDALPLPDDVVAANDAWAPLKRAADEAAKAEKKASAAVKAAVVKSMPYAERFGAVGNTDSGGFQVSVSESTGIDDKAFAAAEPEAHARVEALRVELATLEALAKKRHPLTRRTTSLRFQEVTSA